MSKLETVKVEKGKIIIEIPISLVVCAAKGNPEFCSVRIKDKEAYAQAVAEKIINFNEDSESGISQFHKLFDDIQLELVEESHPSIQVKWDPDGKYE